MSAHGLVDYGDSWLMRFWYIREFGRFVHDVIASATGGLWAHVGVAIYHGTDRLGFESTMTAYPPCFGGGRPKTGLRGPFDFEEYLREWKADAPDKRSYMLQPYPAFLPLSDPEVEAIYDQLCSAVHSITYAHLQLPRNWIEQRTGLHLQFRFGSRAKWTCSETPARILPARVLDYYDLRDLCPDMIVPSGKKLMSVEAGTQAWIAAERTRAA